ncbi:MAG TPA: RNA 3'-phosphate cyclase [Anaerolineales bacterium]|nr:RNA 3'-phosphate cyclase [Anaerolineales bacterium]
MEATGYVGRAVSLSYGGDGLAPSSSLRYNRPVVGVGERWVVVDGSAGEGGGQVLRTALTLSILTGRAVEVREIRAGRPKPGLRPQHLAAVMAAAAICGAEVEGAELGSRRLRFVPRGPARPGVYAFDVAEIAGRGSAGAVGLVLQTVLLPLALSNGPSRLTLRGGTHVPWAPSVDYLQAVFLPAAARMGVRAEVELVAWGFYPVGGGEVQVRIEGRSGDPLEPLRLVERGEVRRVWGRGVASNLPAHIAQRMANRAHNLLMAAWAGAEYRSSVAPSIQIEALRVRGAGPGAAVFLFAEYEHVVAGFSSYGRKGLPSEQVAAAACDDLLTHHRAGAPADPHLADQLVLPMAVASGTSQVATSAITDHLLTNLAVVRAFLSVQAQVEGEQGRPGIITILGSAYD